MPELVEANLSLLTQYLGPLLDVLSDGLYVSDRSGRTLLINERYEKMTGLTREELQDRLVTDLRSEGVFDVVLNPGIVATGRPATSVQVNKHGRKLVLSGYPIFDAEGQVALVATFVRDITLMTQMKEQIVTQRRLIDKYHTNLKYISRRGAESLPVFTENRDMLHLLDLVERIAPTDATALLLGETGVGKGLFARKIHEKSARNGEPFFIVDCASIPENLIESELFGYAPGAFSGAHAKGKAGFFEAADGGTIFLDEIGELPLPMQAKLLRVLQDQELVRLGSTEVRKVDVRVIAATNRDLEEDAAQGRFRSDLYYRLSVTVLSIPPLRERTGDILPLARHFLDKYGARYRKTLAFTPEAEAAMLGHHWPGNVRELENAIQGMVITCDSPVLDVLDLPSCMQGAGRECASGSRLMSYVDRGRATPLKDIMRSVERDLLRAAVERLGSVAAAARHFSVDRTTVFRKLYREK